MYLLAVWSSSALTTYFGGHLSSWPNCRAVPSGVYRAAYCQSSRTVIACGSHLRRTDSDVPDSRRSNWYWPFDRLWRTRRRKTSSPQALIANDFTTLQKTLGHQFALFLLAAHSVTKPHTVKMGVSVQVIFCFLICSRYHTGERLWCLNCTHEACVSWLELRRCFLINLLTSGW